MRCWCWIAIVSLGCVAEPAGTLSQLHQAGGADLHVRRDPETGEITQLAGYFPSPRGAVDAEWIETILDAMAEGRSNLAVRSVGSIEPGADLVSVDQIAGGLPVRERTILVQIEGDAIVGISGRLVGDAPISPAVDAEALALRMGMMNAHDARRFWDAELARPVVSVEGPEGAFLLDDRGTVLRAGDGNDRYEGSVCSIRHPLYNPEDLSQVIGHATDRDSKCGRENVSSSVCAWELSYHPWVDHALGRVQDEGFPLARVSGPCSSTPAHFWSSDASLTRQQTLYYATERMRTFVEQNMWSRVAPSAQADVQINIREDVCDDARACFNRWSTDIYIDRARADNESRNVQTIMHEYGHYVNWTYGNFSSDCNATNEGQALNETFADIVALISLIDDPDFGARYNSDGVRLSQQPGRHMNDNAVLQYEAGQCRSTMSDDELHDLGRPLQQAMWEILWNHDCSGRTCAADVSAFGSELWPGIGQEDWLKIVGEAIARALYVTPESTTFDEVLDWFVIRITTQATNRLGSVPGSIVGRNVQNVLEHHGFHP